MSKIVKVQAPDGSIIKVEGPDDATDEQFLQQGAILWRQQQQNPLLQSRREISRMEFERNLPPSTVLSRMEAVGQGATEGATGALKSVMQMMGMGLTGNATAATQFLKNLPAGVVQGVTGAPSEMIQGLQTGDYDRMARGAGSFLTTTVPAVEGLARTAGVVGSKPIAAAREYVPERLGSSIVKPLEANKEFGANPVQAFNENVGVAGTMKSAVARMDQAKVATEAQLMRTAAKYSDATTDIAPEMKAAVDPILKELRLDGKDAIAKQISEMLDRRLSDVKEQYGSTKLNPLQIIEVKRALTKGIKFTEDVTQESLNTAKMAAYRGVDATLDRLTNGETKPINETYSGLIEATGRLKARQQQMLNQDFSSIKGGIGSIIERMPSTAVKTLLIQLFRNR